MQPCTATRSGYIPFASEAQVLNKKKLLQAYYPDPTTFDGNRFVDVDGSDLEKEEFNKNSVVNLRNDYIIFGHGRPGW